MSEDSEQPSDPPRGQAPPPPPPGLTPPPGYVAYGGAGTPGAYQPFQRIGGLAKAMVVLLTIYVPVAAIGIVVQFVLADKASQHLDGRSTENEFRDSFNSLASADGLESALTIVLAVLTIIWMVRLARNLRILGRTDATWAPGWAIGGWFLPPCGIYVIPWLMLRELWKGSDPRSGPNDPRWRSNPVPGLVNVWWVLFGPVPAVAFLVGAITGGLPSFAALTSDADSRERAEAVRDGVPLNTVLSVSQIAAAVVFLLIVRQLSTNHRRLTAEA